jgi:glycosyltransferase involved in cell wall biosynthesis
MAVVPGLVSTIIPVYNRPAMLQRAVDSVLAQTWPSFEIIICDDGSTDSTPELGRQLQHQHPGRITYLWNPNRGAGPAREAGRQRAQGEFIQYLDSDDTLWPRKFEVQIKALRERPDCGVAYGQIRLCREGEPPSEKPHKWSGRELPTLFPWLLVDRWWNTDAPLWRRTVCDQIGSWTDFRYSQDWEYDARAGALGVRLAYCPEFVTDQHHHATERQTGHGRWLVPRDRVRFFEQLLRCARSAGVAADAVEMRHFSRWVFANARQCGAMDDAGSAEQLVAIAAEAADQRALDVKAYALAAKLMGWTRLGKLSDAAQRLRGNKVGKDTLKQSWMGN